MIAVLMGVTGSGKTTVGQAIAAQTGWHFADADDYHSDANRAKMHAGIPLTDEDREPWLRTLHAVLVGWQRAGESGVMACSALKQKYRQILAGGMPEGELRFILLEVPRDVLADRLAHRANHFMSPALLDSQLATLDDASEALRVDANRPPAEVAADIVTHMRA